MELTPTLPLLAILAAIGVGTGTLGAILGTGGGVFLIPVLVLGFDVPMRFAIGTSILSVIATSTAVAIANVERGTANMRLGMTLEIGMSLGAIVGGSRPASFAGIFSRSSSDWSWCRLRWSCGGSGRVTGIG